MCSDSRKRHDRPRRPLRGDSRHPDDDTPPLVFADYLEENGEAEYAAFIRKQIELARLPEWDPARLRAEYLDHAATRGDNWYGTKWCDLRLPEGIDWAGATFRRGFPAAVAVHGADAFMKYAPDLFRAAPVDDLELWPNSPREETLDVRAIADSPWLARIRRLELPLAKLNRNGVARLCDSPHAQGLIDLNVETSLEQDVTPARLFRGSFVGRLRKLAIHVPEQHTAGTLAAIRKVRGTCRLRHLRLTSCANTARPALLCEPDFYSATMLEDVTELDLSHNRVLAEALGLLLRAPFLDRLESLRLNMTELGSETQSLVRSPRLVNLRYLHLSQNHMTPKDVQVLAKSPHMSNLRVLNLERNPVGNAGAAALAKSPYLQNLLVLDLMFCNVGDDGAQALLDSPLSPTLISLHLYSPDKAISPAMKRKLRKQFGNRVNV